MATVTLESEQPWLPWTDPSTITSAPVRAKEKETHLDTSSWPAPIMTYAQKTSYNQEIFATLP